MLSDDPAGATVADVHELMAVNVVGPDPRDNCNTSFRCQEDACF